MYRVYRTPLDYDGFNNPSAYFEEEKDAMNFVDFLRWEKDCPQAGYTEVVGRKTAHEMINGRKLEKKVYRNTKEENALESAKRDNCQLSDRAWIEVCKAEIDRRKREKL